MTTIYGLGNDVDLDLNNISAAESDEDDRQDQIKELLAGALSNETFYDDNESEASFVHNNYNQDDNDNRKGVNDISLHSFHSNPNLANISTNGFAFLNGYSDKPQYNAGEPEPVHHPDFRKRSADPKNSSSLPHAPQTDRGNEEVEARNATVSVMHKMHCPQHLGNGEVEEESQEWLRTSSSKAEQLKTLCDFRERQIARCEETISTLTKDKRALSHQVGLMKTEMIQIRGTHDELEKAIKLKNEETNYLKSKIQEAINEFQNLKRAETDLKDENNRLSSEISRLEQEVKLTSTIGSSVQQAEVSEVVRHMREKHAREIASWKAIAAELEGQIRIHKRSEQIYQSNSTSPKINCTTQTETNGSNSFTRGTQSDRIFKNDEISTQTDFGRNSLPNETTPPATEPLTKFTNRDAEIVAFYEDEKRKLILLYEKEIEEHKARLRALPAKLYSTWKETEMNNSVIPKVIMLDAATSTFTETRTVSTTCDINSPEKIKNGRMAMAETQTHSTVKDVALQFASTMVSGISPPKMKTSTISISVQTEETMKTYEVLAGLIEQWAQEVADSAKKAEIADTQAKFAQESLKELRKKFKDVSRMVSMCRREWKTREQLLVKKHTDTKAHYIRLLKNLGQTLESLEDGGNGS